MGRPPHRGIADSPPAPRPELAVYELRLRGLLAQFARALDETAIAALLRRMADELERL